MNERVKELWELTGILWPQPGHYPGVSEYALNHFARLIIEECADRARECYSQDEDACEHIASRILELGKE
jgi:hypothetical protein